MCSDTCRSASPFTQLASHRRDAGYGGRVSGSPPGDVASGQPSAAPRPWKRNDWNRNDWRVETQTPRRKQKTPETRRYKKIRRGEFLTQCDEYGFGEREPDWCADSRLGDGG